MAAIINVGEVIVGPSQLMSPDTLMKFENVIWRRGLNVHSDPDAAKDSGMDRMIASGQNQLALIHQMMEERFANGWKQGGRISMRWVRPVFVDDTITPFAEVKAVTRADGRMQVSVEIWCENQEKEKTGVGSAQAFLEA